MKVVCPLQFSENVLRAWRKRETEIDGQLWHARALRQLLTVSASHHIWHNTNTPCLILHYSGRHGSLLKNTGKLILSYIWRPIIQIGPIATELSPSAVTDNAWEKKRRSDLWIAAVCRCLPKLEISVVKWCTGVGLDHRRLSP